MDKPVSLTSLTSCVLESKINSVNKSLDEIHSDVDSILENQKDEEMIRNEIEENIEFQVQSDFVLQESNLNNIHQNRDDTKSDKMFDTSDENLSFHQLNDKDHLINGAKKENNLHYSLDLKPHNDSQLSLLFDQLRDLYFEQQLLDCTLVCEDECIKAHKLILAAVSPYFRSIFNSFNNYGCTNTAVIVQDVSARDMRLIIKIIYSVSNYSPVKLSLNRAISLRKSAYRLRIDFINDRLDQCGVPQLNKDLILNITTENNLFNESLNERKRKRSYPKVENHQRLNSSINSLACGLSKSKLDKIESNQSSSDSADENSSECSASMKHHKYKHRYLLTDEHLDQNEKLIKCVNSEIILSPVEQLNDKINEDEVMLDDNQHIDQEIESGDESMNNIENDNSDEKRKSIDSSSPNHIYVNESDSKNSISINNENLVDLSQISRLKSMNAQQSNELKENVIDFSLAKHPDSQEEMFELVNSALNNADNTEKVSNLFKAMKSEMNKLWSNSNNDLISNDHLSQLNNQINNHLLNRTFSKLCMASANLNPETARALLLTNELLKNSAVNKSQSNHHSMNKNSAENSLNTSTSSTNSSFGNVTQSNNNSNAALVAVAQQHLINAGFLGKNSTITSINNKQNSTLNSSLLNTSKSSNNHSSQNGSSSSSSSYNSLNTSNGPVKRGRGRPPRHTQPSGSDVSSTNNDNLLTKLSTQTPQNVKSSFSPATDSTFSNSLSNLNSSTASSIADSLNAFNQHKKWKPNLENLLALKIRRNKPITGSNTSSPVNDLTNTNNSNQSINVSSKNSSSNASLLNNYSHNVNNSSIINNGNANGTNSVGNLNGSSSSNSTSNTADGKQQNMCPYCPQVYYSNQAMNDHINNVHTKTAFKYICEFCSKEFSWKISLTKHLKHAHSDLSSTFGTRPVNSLNVTSLNGLTSTISNHLGSGSLTNQELLHSFMNRDSESTAMLNFGAIGD